MKKYLFLFSAISALISAPAVAADMPLKAPPPPAPVFSWTGPYFGVQGGFGWAQDTWLFPTGQVFTPALQAAGTVDSFSPHMSGALFGGEIGYYIGMNNTPIVFGFEIAGDWSDVKQTVVGPFATLPNDSFKTKLEDLETYMARVGYATGNWLWYVEAGAGTGRVTLTGASAAPNAAAGATFSTSDRLGGLAVGGGIDTVWDHWLLGVEYKYVDLGTFGNRTFTAVCSAAGGTCVAAGSLVNVTVGDGSNGFHVQAILGRLGYKF
jgi:outer membrane immunogenic protein